MLGQSMIIAPDSEQALYEQRHDFDLIVYYDQDSMLLPEQHTTGSDGALLHFRRAICDYDYEQKLKRQPMLLEGGLDAWTDLLGPNSLASSISRTSSPAIGETTSHKVARPIARVPPARRPPNTPLRRKKTHSSRPLTKEEESEWDQTLRADSAQWTASEAERMKSAELVYAKTTEDFFRRFPEVPTIQESMVTPSPADRPAQAPEMGTSAIPAPPARPAPALPRQRSSGLSERGPTLVTSAANATGITPHRVTPGLTGLYNPMVTCYMNSAIQAVSATPFLRDLFLTFQQSNHPVPRKEGEHTNPPQLLVRSFSLLMGHLWSGTADFLKPLSFAVSWSYPQLT
jgi:ubiquitin carboxyl-terminal hydrolase 8